MSGAIRLRHIAHLMTATADGGPRPVIALENIESGTGKLVPGTDFAETPPREFGVADVEPGDVLFGKLRPYLAKSWVADRPVRASTELLCLRPGAGIDSAWLGYAVASTPFIDWAVATSEGTKMPRTSWSRLGDFRFVLPPMAEQRSIAEHLQRETDRIDALIAAKQRMTRILEERQSSWLHAVLGQCAHVSGTVPLKSVAQWVEGPGIMATDFREEGVPLLRIKNLAGDSIDLTDCGFVPESLVTERWNHLRVRTGELLVSGSARSGTPVVIPREADGAVPYTGLMRIWPKGGELDRDYLRMFLASPMFNSQIDRLKTGVGLQHWGPYHLSQVRIPLPAIETQRSLMARFISQEQCQRTIMRLSDNQYRLLQEHRQALISAAVTGQLGIPEAA